MSPRNRDFDQEPEWCRTIHLRERVVRNPFYEEPDKESREGYFGGRHIIARDTPINKGVCLGGNEREAIVVDDEKDPVLGEIYQELLKRLAPAEASGTPKLGLLDEVFKLVCEKLPYDADGVDNIVAKAGAREDKKISLANFINNKPKPAGVCRHQALLSAYLLERLIKDGKVGGKVSIDRNYVPGLGGHAWTRYTSRRGFVSILDPAQRYIGLLSRVGEMRWFYERPEDIAAAKKAAEEAGKK